MDLNSKLSPFNVLSTTTGLAVLAICSREVFNLIKCSLCSLLEFNLFKCSKFLAKASFERFNAPVFILAIASKVRLAPNLEPAIFKILYSGGVPLDDRYNIALFLLKLKAHNILKFLT